MNQTNDFGNHTPTKMEIILFNQILVMTNQKKRILPNGIFPAKKLEIFVHVLQRHILTWN